MSILKWYYYTLLVLACISCASTRGLDRDDYTVPIDRDSRNAAKPVKSERTERAFFDQSFWQTFLIDTRNIPKELLKYDDLIRNICRKDNLDYYYVCALIWHESSGRPTVVSASGCIGLTQLKRSTARDYDPDITVAELKIPEYHLDIAGQHLAKSRKLIRKRFGKLSHREELRLLTAVWNAGWGNVHEHGGIPPFTETEQLVNKVMNSYDAFQPPSIFNWR